MSNPKNIKLGLKKIFTATILEIIALAVALVALVISKTVADQTANAVGIVIFGLTASVLAIISIVLNIIGLHATSKEESNFKNAYDNSIAALIATIINAIISNISGVPPFVREFFSIFADITNLSVIIYVCNGLAALLRESGKTDLAKRSSSIIVLVVIAFIVSVFFGNANAETFAPDQLGNIILLVIGASCELIGYIMYLFYIKKTSKVL